MKKIIPILVFFVLSCQSFNKRYIPGYRVIINGKYQDVLVYIQLPENYIMKITIPAKRKVKEYTKTILGADSLILDKGKKYPIRIYHIPTHKKYEGLIIPVDSYNLNTNKNKVEITNLTPEIFNFLDKGKIYIGDYYLGPKKLIKLILANSKIWASTKNTL